MSCRLITGLLFALTAGLALGQTWTPIKHQPTFSPGNAMLLKDGTVFAQDADNSDWWKLTPDSTGSYINGTWTQLPSTPGYGPLYYASQVLPDGRVFTMGGEYNLGSTEIWQNQGYIYNPMKNSWTKQAAPSGWNNMGDTGSVVLPNGFMLLQDPFNSSGALFNPANNSFSVPYGSGKADMNDEEGLTLLPNGNILTVDAWDIPNTEIFNVNSATWSSAGNTPAALADSKTAEVGPGVLRPDGTVIYFGATGHCAVFNTNTNTWSSAPDLPSVGGTQMQCEDAPAALLTSGNVLVQTSPYFSNPCYYFEWNGSSFTKVPGPADSPYVPSFAGTFLMLPTGQLLHVDQDTDVEVYTSSGQPNSGWAPVITNCPTSLRADFAYTISGRQFTGLSGDSAYGDDNQNETNYPLIRITNNKTGHVFYCREYSPSTCGICTGSTIVSADFQLPANIDLGPSTLQVVTNGIPSNTLSVTVYPAVQASAVSLFRGTNPSGNVQDIWYVDGLTFNGQSVLDSAGQDAIIEADFNFPSSNIAGLTIVATAAASLNTNGSQTRTPTTNSGTSGMLYAYNWVTQTFDFFGSAGLSTTQSTFSASASNPPSDYVNPSTGEVRVLVRGVRPTHVSQSPFILSADAIEIQPS